jgi:hypothetical protein
MVLLDSHAMAPDYIHKLHRAVENGTLALLALGDEASATRPGASKWSPREIIGHLVDSASNNHDRFVRAQLQEDLIFQGYDQRAWVAVQRYQDAPWDELVTLWRTFNLHLVRVMAAVPDEVRLRPRAHHTLHEIGFSIPWNEPARLDDLMRDYVDHLVHHLRQILGPDWTPDTPPTP